MKTQSHEKILPLEELAARLDDSRGEKTVVHCHGVFDLLHVGHLRYLREAATLGDLLVVTVTPDKYVNKGPHRPVFTGDLRAEALAALDCVDFVAINNWPTAVETIHLLKPAFYVKGAEFRNPEDDKTGKIVDEEQAIRAVGGRIHFTDDIVFSSTNIINRELSPFNSDVRDFLRDFSARHDCDEVVGYLEKASSLRVLCFGETIIDEYHFCETIGKSGKEPILAARHLHEERYAGGILAIANHLAQFAGQVELLTALGELEPQREFVTQHLDPRVRPRFLTQSQAPTIVKRRFVEAYPTQKLFEIYMMNNSREARCDPEQVRESLARIMGEVDLVVVADYGHGLIDDATRDYLCQNAPFLAVNTQLNAGNYGFNTISKYPHADFISISEKELRIEARSTARPLEDLVLETAERLGCTRVLITRGKQGCLCWSRDQGFFQAPAFTKTIVDRVGAGDAVLSIVALCVAQGAPIDVASFIGNAVGAHAVATMGNSRPVERVPLIKHVISLMK